MTDIEPIALLLAGTGAGALSAPHCAAMCGPISAAVCTRASARSAPFRYQGGRTVGYAFMGLLAGQLGEALSTLHAGALTGPLFALTVAATGVWLAVHLWRKVPYDTRVTGEPVDVPVARLTSERRRPHGVDWLQSLRSLLPRDPAALGLLSALLPCGALYGGLLLAAATGSAAGGALLMAGFSVTTGVSLVASASALRLRLLSPGGLPARALALLLVTGLCAAAAHRLGVLPGSPAVELEAAADAPACH